VKKLILIRHADAETGSFSTSDFNRKLTDKGKNRAIIQANRIKSMNINPDLIITSNAIRALETTEIISNILSPNCPIQKVPLLYDDFTSSDFFNLLSKIDNSIETIALVGHNPNISVMASRIDSNAKINFAPCSIGIFTLGESWRDADVGLGKLIELIH